MAKVTSKYQVTVPRAIADRYSIRPGDEINWIPAGDVIGVPSNHSEQQQPSAEAQPASSTKPHSASTSAHRPQSLDAQQIADGPARTSTLVAALIDTNILVYRFDGRFPQKQKIATALLRQGIAANSIRVPHQAIIEFVAAVTRDNKGHTILDKPAALREAEEMLTQFTVLYPNEAILRNAVRGCAAYQLHWFDANLWSYAEHYGLPELITEDLQHDRLYGTVRVVNPFL